MSLEADAAEIALLVHDYRASEGIRIAQSDVLTWVRQFDVALRKPLLRELRHVLANTYWSAEKTIAALDRIIASKQYCGPDPQKFWAGTYLMNVQTRGSSQRELVALFDKRLKMAFGAGFVTTSYLSARHFYLDDGLYSGARAQQDLTSWIKSNKTPERLELRCAFLVSHTLGVYHLENHIPKVAKEAGKRVDLRINSFRSFENRKAKRNSSDVLWPAVVPAEQPVQDFLARERKFPFEPRQRVELKADSIFSDEDGRQILEQEFTKVGCRLVGACQNPIQAMRPLGFSNFGLGFGSMCVTHRNCPNNAPLALWWHGGVGGFGPLQWLPLFARRGN